jgi:replicative DNA helicase
MKDRLPPHSLEAEQGVLGCCLLEPSRCVSECQSMGITPEMFYDTKHQTIYGCLCWLIDNNVKLDMVVISQTLKNKNELEGVGGVAYLSHMIDSVPSAYNLPTYVEILREKFLLRKVIIVSQNTIANAYENEGDVTEILDRFETEALSIADSAQKQTEIVPVKELVRESIAEMEYQFQHPNALRGLSTGFPDLDKMLSGLQAPNMFVIAARPSIGKTSLLMDILGHIAIKEKKPVGIFSLEMTAKQLTMRMIASRSRTNLRNLCEGDAPRLALTASDIAKAPIHIDDTAGLTIMQLRARARRMVQRYGVKVIGIDYLQLMASATRRGENRQMEISQMSNGVKAMAKELGVPVIVLSQLNREFEKEKNRKPRMSDLRESGSIEQDADEVGILYRPQTEEEMQQGDPNIIPVNLLICKQRNGNTGDIHLTFFKEFTRFESCTRVWED